MDAGNWCTAAYYTSCRLSTASQKGSRARQARRLPPETWHCEIGTIRCLPEACLTREVLEQVMQDAKWLQLNSTMKGSPFVHICSASPASWYLPEASLKPHGLTGPPLKYAPLAPLGPPSDLPKASLSLVA